MLQPHATEPPSRGSFGAGRSTAAAAVRQPVEDGDIDQTGPRYGRTDADPAASESGSAKDYLPGPRPRGLHRLRGLYALKFILAALALGLIALVAVWPHLPSTGGGPGVGVFGRNFSATLGMTEARFVGTDRENRPFTIYADTVHNTVPGGGEVSLNAPEAGMTLQNGAWVFVVADRGDYDLEKKFLELTGDVRLFHDSGYEFKSSEANVEMETNRVSGSKAVDVQGPAGLLSADGFEISNDGKTVTFTGHAKMTILPRGEE